MSALPVENDAWAYRFGPLARWRTVDARDTQGSPDKSEHGFHTRAARYHEQQAALAHLSGDDETARELLKRARRAREKAAEARQQQK